MDIAQLGYEIDSSQARTAARDLDKMNAASQKAEKGARSLKAASENLLRDEKGRFMATAQAAEKYGTEIDRLRTKYNPLYAASKQYEASMSELKRALELGAISTAQFDAAQERLQQSLLSTSGAMQTMGHVSQQGAMQAGNVFAQINDIGVMMASGQNPFILALQQGTQLNQVWADMGAKGKSLSGVMGMLGAGFAQFLNPVGLATIAIIAGSAALVQWGASAFGASEDTRSLDDVMSDLSSSVDNYKSMAEKAVSTDLGEEFGRYAGQARELYGVLRDLGQLDAAKALRDAQAAIMETDIGLVASKTYFNFDQIKSAMQGLASEFDTTEANARRIVAAINGIGSAQGPEQAAQSTKWLNDLLIEVYGSTLNIPPALQELATQAANGNMAALQLLATMDGVSNSTWSAANAASSLAARLGAAAVSGATQAKEQLAIINAQIAAVNAGQDEVVAGKRAALDLDRQAYRNAQLSAGVDAGIVAASERALFADRERVIAAEAQLTAAQKLRQEQERENGKGSVGGGGGGSDQYQSNLQSLIESLQTEQETVDAWYQSSLAILNDRRASEILSTQEHNELKLALEREYQEKLAGIRDSADQYGLSSASEFFSDLYSLSGSKYDGLLKMQKTFAAASALLNTYLAASQTLADPTLGFWAKFAAVAKVIAAGMGLVNAIKGGGTSGGGASSGGASTSATAATKAEPERVTRVVLQGDDWLVNMAESIMTQIYDASSNGRVIVSRG